MAFSNPVLNDIYNYLGYNNYVTFDAEVKSTILAQQQSPAGAQPDNYIETKVAGLLAKLATVIVQMDMSGPTAIIGVSSTGARLMPIKNLKVNKDLARMYIKELLVIFGLTATRTDYFGQASSCVDRLFGGGGSTRYNT